MSKFDLDRLEKAAEPLALAFYGLMLISLGAALGGAPGWGFLALVLGACVHVGRASVEEFVETQRAREERAEGRRQEPRLMSTRSRLSSRPTAEFVVTATRDKRRVKLGR